MTTPSNLYAYFRNNSTNALTELDLDLIRRTGQPSSLRKVCLVLQAQLIFYRELLINPFLITIVVLISQLLASDHRIQQKTFCAEREQVPPPPGSHGHYTVQDGEYNACFADAYKAATGWVQQAYGLGNLEMQYAQSKLTSSSPITSRQTLLSKVPARSLS